MTTADTTLVERKLVFCESRSRDFGLDGDAFPDPNPLSFSHGDETFTSWAHSFYENVEWQLFIFISFLTGTVRRAYVELRVDSSQPNLSPTKPSSALIRYLPLFGLGSTRSLSSEFRIYPHSYISPNSGSRFILKISHCHTNQQEFWRYHHLNSVPAPVIESIVNAKSTHRLEVFIKI